jgi:hypothetical protein
MASSQSTKPLFPLALCAALASLSWVAPAAADEPTIEEATYDPSAYPPAGTRGRLLLTGAALMVGWYGVALGTSYLWQEAPNAKDLRLPVVGPFLALRDVGCGNSERSCETAIVVFRTAVSLVAGVGQLGGLVVFGEGLFVDSGPAPAPSASAEALRFVPPPSRDEKRAVHKLSSPGWDAAPFALPDGSLGLGVSGRF